MWHGHNDMHPAFNSLLPGLKIDAPESLIGGEALLAKIYRAVRSSSSTTGSNAYNTLLMVNFDEHGGTYDHVPPPAVAPPDPSAPPGQFGFRFDRSGVRVPALAISAWIPPRTVVNDEYRNTSIIRTMRERWSLGAPFSARDGAARDVAPVLSLDTPRAPEDWPEVTERPVPRPDAALAGRGRAVASHGPSRAVRALGPRQADRPRRARHLSRRHQERGSHLHAARHLRSHLSRSPGALVVLHPERGIRHAGDIVSCRRRPTYPCSTASPLPGSLARRRWPGATPRRGRLRWSRSRSTTTPIRRATPTGRKR